MMSFDKSQNLLSAKSDEASKMSHLHTCRSFRLELLCPQIILKSNCYLKVKFKSEDLSGVFKTIKPLVCLKD